MWITDCVGAVEKGGWNFKIKPPKDGVVLGGWPS